jgi:hypothetical protein
MKRWVKQNYGFVGINGEPVWLGAGDEYDTSSPVYIADPDRFTDQAPAGVEPEPKRRGGRRG